VKSQLPGKGGSATRIFPADFVWPPVRFLIMT